ncbi:MAG: TetR/AcrR family transcriptional regulator [Thermoleophilia bacterium]|nr:TetR/AcrR family transcriptional regulator [Thermoleophilia bacterium]
MPKISHERKAERRAEIVAGARRCFAREGYEGATVARLEAEIGLSRGAIFNYFESKADLFLAVVEQTSLEYTEIWLDRGFRALLDEIVRADADWLAVQLEAIRRFRTDNEFKRRAQEQDRRLAETRPDRMERLRAQGLRDDVPLETVGIFLGIVANGLALRVTVADPLPDLDELFELVQTGVAPRRPR